MPASLPGATLAQNVAGPTQGRAVVFDPLSGPKGSPFDRDQAGNCSTGALSTGIGYGPASPFIVAQGSDTAAQAIAKASYTDDQIPGARSNGFGTQNTLLSRFMYVGGGRMVANADPVQKYQVPFVPSEYTAGIALCTAGNGAARDNGAGPAFTGASMKMVTATGAVANGAAVETGFVNRSGVALVSGQSLFGVASAALAAPSLTAEEEEAAHAKAHAKNGKHK